MAISVVPPPISTRATPAYFSSSVSTASPDASADSIMVSCARLLRGNTFADVAGCVGLRRNELKIGPQFNPITPNRLVDVGFVIDHKIHWQHMDNFLVGRNGVRYMSLSRWSMSSVCTSSPDDERVILPLDLTDVTCEPLKLTFTT